MAPPAKRHEPPQEIALAGLTAFGSGELESGGDYDAVAFDGVDLTDGNANNARFLDCRLERCRVDGLLLRRARIVDCLLSDVQGVSLDLTESVWRDSLLSGGRLGAVTAPAATWARVRVRAAKLDYVNLRGAQLQDVVFERCVIGAIDLAGAELTAVSFVDSTVDDITVDGATLSQVDLSRARLRMIRGLEGLRGAIVSHGQLLDLAPLLADHLGLTVDGDG